MTQSILRRETDTYRGQKRTLSLNWPKEALFKQARPCSAEWNELNTGLSTVYGATFTPICSEAHLLNFPQVLKNKASLSPCRGRCGRPWSKIERRYRLPFRERNEQRDRSTNRNRAQPYRTLSSNIFP